MRCGYCNRVVLGPSHRRGLRMISIQSRIRRVPKCRNIWIRSAWILIAWLTWMEKKSKHLWINFEAASPWPTDSQSQNPAIPHLWMNPDERQSRRVFLSLVRFHQPRFACRRAEPRSLWIENSMKPTCRAWHGAFRERALIWKITHNTDENESAHGEDDR